MEEPIRRNRNPPKSDDAMLPLYEEQLRTDGKVTLSRPCCTEVAGSTDGSNLFITQEIRT